MSIDELKNINKTHISLTNLSDNEKERFIKLVDTLNIEQLGILDCIFGHTPDYTKFPVSCRVCGSIIK